MAARDAREAVVASRVAELLRSYEPPDFAEVPTADAALFLTAIDHHTGYEAAHSVEGSDPVDGSALLWALGLRAEAAGPGALSAGRLAGVTEGEVRDLFAVEGEEVAGPELRAGLWRDLAAQIKARYDGEAGVLIAAAEGMLGGSGGLLERLAEFEAFSDPLRKKSFLVCKIWERRGWLEVRDPDSWEVCADNVLMRLALRAGLVAPGQLEQVRAATREAWKRIAERIGVNPPVLDDLLWERGRDNPDLVGGEAGDLWEPPRPERGFFDY